MAIASSVLQAVETRGSGKRFWTFDASELSGFMREVDAAGGYGGAVAGRDINGWTYHLTAKSPDAMERLGFRNMGHTSLRNAPYK